jgi:zinc carboxypeptidase
VNTFSRWPLMALLPLVACSGETQPDLSHLQTRAEATDFTETTRFDEVVEMSRALADASPRVHLTTFGTTTEGRDLPLLVVGDVPDASAEAVRASGKLPVYLQGDIHAGEVAGKEALLMLVRNWIEGEYPDWTDKLVLLVAPIYNADGNERVELTNRPRQNGPIGGMGQRANAMGLDLNRDHMKLDSPEARSFARLLTEYDPYLGVDLHTTNGTRHAYYLTYAPPLHPDTPGSIDALLREDWLPHVTTEIKAKYGWDYYYYGNAFGLQGSEPAWRTFDHRPRFNNNYIGLRNRFAILSEAYAYATFRDRVDATLFFVEEILHYARDNADRIRGIVEEADAESIVGRPLAVRSRPRRSAEPVTILMGEADEEVHPETGEVMLRRRDVSNPVEMYEFGTFEAAETEVAPAAYLIPKELSDVLDRLTAHGVRTDPLESEVTLQVEVFRVDSTLASERAFQNRNERQVWGAYRAEERTLPPGTVVVAVDQPLGRLAFHLLEPRADDGFVNWAILDGQVEVGGDYPIVRSRAPVGR